MQYWAFKTTLALEAGKTNCWSKLSNLNLALKHVNPSVDVLVCSSSITPCTTQPQVRNPTQTTSVVAGRTVQQQNQITERAPQK